MDTVTVYALIVWLGAQPVMDPDDGHTAWSAGEPHYVGDYDTLARCKVDLKIYSQTAYARCVPHSVQRAKVSP